MFDCHSHILPGIDDGSKNVQESLEILQDMKKQGIKYVIATSHFYASQNSPESFLEKRQEAYEKLKPHLNDSLPRIFLGAEVYYFDGISETKSVEKLKIQNTKYLMLEMPFKQWTPKMIREIVDLNDKENLTVILAHIDRYLKYVSEEDLDMLISNGVKVQVNCSPFFKLLSRNKVLKMIKENKIHIVGSDTHNMSSRPCEIKKAFDIIEDKLGRNQLKQLWLNAQNILNDL